MIDDFTSLSFGDAFEVKSKRGSHYSLTLIHVGEGESGLFVRAEDGRIARLHHSSLDWDTLRVKEDGDALRPGDRLLVESESGVLQGALESTAGDTLRLALPIGIPISLPRAELEACFLVFQARNLKRGDRLFVKSKSGNEYRGNIRAVGPGEKIRLRLENGTTTNLRLHKVDLSTLVVLIPLPTDDLFEKTRGALAG